MGDNLQIIHDESGSRADWRTRRFDTWRGIARFESYLLGELPANYPVPAVRDSRRKEKAMRVVTTAVYEAEDGSLHQERIGALRADLTLELGRLVSTSAEARVVGFVDAFVKFVSTNPGRVAGVLSTFLTEAAKEAPPLPGPVPEPEHEPVVKPLPHKHAAARRR